MAEPARSGPELLPPGPAGRPYDIVFLDRDGTVNVRRPGYVTRPEDLDLLPGAASAVARLNASGARVVLVTNQRGIARGVMSAADLEWVHEHLVHELARSGAHLDGIEVCPHAEGACRCRKPSPGLFLGALRRAPWADPLRCAVVGDQSSDVVPGRELGMATVLLGEEAPDLSQAVECLLSVAPGPPGRSPGSFGCLRAGRHSATVR